MPRYRQDFKVEIPNELRARVDAICNVLDIPVKDACTEALSWWVAKYALIAEENLPRASAKKGLQEIADAKRFQEFLQLDPLPPPGSDRFCDINQTEPE